MYEAIIALALLHPIEYKRDSCWAGFTSWQAGNVRGHTVKVVRWWGGSVVVEFGVWNTLMVSKKVW